MHLVSQIRPMRCIRRNYFWFSFNSMLLINRHPKSFKNATHLELRPKAATKTSLDVGILSRYKSTYKAPRNVTFIKRVIRVTNLILRVDCKRPHVVFWNVWWFLHGYILDVLTVARSTYHLGTTLYRFPMRDVSVISITNHVPEAFQIKSRRVHFVISSESWVCTGVAFVERSLAGCIFRIINLIRVLILC